MQIVDVVHGYDPTQASDGRACDGAAIAYLVVVGTVAAFGLFLFVLGRSPASRASYQFVLMPLVAAVAASLLLDEPLSASLLVGGAVVLAGVSVGALTGAAPPVPAAPDQEALALRCSTT